MQKPARVYDLIADRWNEKHYKTRSWVRFFRHFIAKKGVLLDAGCGNAINSIYLAPIAKKIYAVDLSKRMVSLAKSNVKKEKLSKGIAVTHADVLNLPFITVKNIDYSNRGSKGKVVSLNFSDNTSQNSARVYYLIEKKQIVSLVEKCGFKVKSFFYEKRGVLTSRRSGFNSCLVLQKL